MALCECGCGGQTQIAMSSHAARGYVKGEPKRFISGHNRRLIQAKGSATCPVCGGPKTRPARRCRNCPRTDTPARGRPFAQRWFPMPDLCERCEKVPPLDRHHKDGDTTNNAPENIAFLCRRCHMAVDGRLEFVRKVMPKMGAAASLFATEGAA